MTGSSQNDSARATAIATASRFSGSVVDGVAGLPVRVELGVEPPQRLDLHGVAHPAQHPGLHPVGEALAGLAGQDGPHGGEVEAQGLVAPRSAAR